ncbi:MAG: shikimate dehydrogenase [Deltaproteobacteria bacterium]|nr:shikimate dehydrogenase [Deltaproteobacteria bacterium]
MPQLNGSTKVLAIIGHPVEHSRSPAMQNAALAACGLDYVYVPFGVPPERLAAAVSGLRALGVAGFNVTIPHKIAVMAHLDLLDESAEAAGAVNTVLNDAGRLIGYNTDGEGLVRSLAEDLGVLPGNGTIVIVGAGGAARGAIAALCRAGAGRIVVVNRGRERALELAQSMARRYGATEIIPTADAAELRPWLGDTALLVNTTSLGMQHEAIPFLRVEELPRTAAVYDMVYAPPVTPLLRGATACGLNCANGLGMLAAQGELAFRIWTGALPPAGVMRGVLAAVHPSSQQLDNTRKSA